MSIVPHHKGGGYHPTRGAGTHVKPHHNRHGHHFVPKRNRNDPRFGPQKAEEEIELGTNDRPTPQR